MGKKMTQQMKIDQLTEALEYMVDSHIEYCELYGSSIVADEEMISPHSAECVVKAREAIKLGKAAPGRVR